MIRTYDMAVHGTWLERLYRDCHPTWPAREAHWWFAHPTLVLEDDDFGAVGATSFSLSLPPQELVSKIPVGETCYGFGVWVDPFRRGRGFGERLAHARLSYARLAGATYFLGMTWARNHAMVRIFERHGFVALAEIPGAYPHNGPDVNGIMYGGKL